MKNTKEQNRGNTYTVICSRFNNGKTIKAADVRNAALMASAIYGGCVKDAAGNIWQYTPKGVTKYSR